MGYTSKRGRRPDEYASKSAHSHVIRDPDVLAFLTECNIPKKVTPLSFSPDELFKYEPIATNPIQTIIAVDGGFTEVPVQIEYPSATICFFQFGALIFSVEDLDRLQLQAFIDPDDMAKLKAIQRMKFTLPVRNIALKDATSLTDSIRRSIYDFFCIKTDDDSLIDTLRWFLFTEYDQPSPHWILASCPSCHHNSIPLERAKMTASHTFNCPNCNGSIYLTDVLRLHEAVDDYLGAGGILGYVSTSFEQLIVAHLIRLILRTKPALLDHILFVKDGPLAFFGQTANMHDPMRRLIRHLFSHHNLYLAGFEKSGAFVEHADEIAPKLPDGSYLVLDNDYIYKYILPGKADPANPYGRTTYYGNKLIFKTSGGAMYVLSIPTSQILAYPKRQDFHNLEVILTNVEKLKCDMYDSSLIPVALVNQLVSLANHPSSRILQKFAVQSVGH